MMAISYRNLIPVSGSIPADSETPQSMHLLLLGCLCDFERQSLHDMFERLQTQPSKARLERSPPSKSRLWK